MSCYINQLLSSIPDGIITKWIQDGITVAGGNGRGKRLNQLGLSFGLGVDDEEETIYISELVNSRITGWKYNARSGQVILDTNEPLFKQLRLPFSPAQMTFDKKSSSLFICHPVNKQVVRWSRRNGPAIILNILCHGIAIDSNGEIYVSDRPKNEVRRFKIGDVNGTVVAGGNGLGDNLNRLASPEYLFVDQDYSVYVSEKGNNRVTKWEKDAKEGVVVAGGQGQGNNLTQLFQPQGLIVDHVGNVYVADSGNSRIMFWSPGAKEGSIIVGRNGPGNQMNQLQIPKDLSFDRQGNLFVLDMGNDRVQKFAVDRN